MCGIVGIVNKHSTLNLEQQLLDSLKIMEYRGYDSAGMSFLDKKNQLNTLKTVGNTSKLELKAKKLGYSSCNMGIAHTRWATQGVVSEHNAHPFTTTNISMILNGIIENFAQLKQDYCKGIEFHSSTDSEVLVKMVQIEIDKGKEPLKAVISAVDKTEGRLSAVFLFKDKKIIIGVKKGPPLLISKYKESSIIASDALAISQFSNQAIYLDTNQLALLQIDKEPQFFDCDGKKITKEYKDINVNYSVNKGSYKYYMYKEIIEQSSVIKNIIQSKAKNNEVRFYELKELNFSKFKRIIITAAGSSYYAGLMAKHWLEEFTNYFIEVEISSELLYKDKNISADTLIIAISQSGETIDTLNTIENMQKKGLTILSFVNVEGSSIYEKSDFKILLQSGYEIGVASTKAMLSQITLLFLFSLYLAKKQNYLKSIQIKNILDDFYHLPSLIANITSKKNSNEDHIKKLAYKLSNSKSLLYIGRNINSIVAMEGALKLKELTYIHAEAYPAGELKHGPIALIDNNMWTIVVADKNQLYSKTEINAREIKARKGKLAIITNYADVDNLLVTKQDIIYCDTKEYKWVFPFCAIVCEQLLAYYVALYLGNNIDQPRNLAKSVTVE